MAIRRWPGATPAHVEAAITTVAEPTVATLRRAARSAAAEQHGAQLQLVPAEATEAEAAADAKRAEAAAEGLATSWRGSYERAREAGAEVADAHEQATVDLVTTYAERTGATEAAHAYNSETMRLAREAIDAGASITLAWTSVLDKGTCDECASLHGTELAPTDDPPPLHPHCLCTMVAE